MPDFVKVVLVELADEACKVAMFEMLWEDVLCELLVLERRDGQLRRTGLGVSSC